MTSRYYRQSIREADPLKSPISITSVEQATKIGELGVLFCVNVKNQEVYVLSPKSPLGAKLVGLRVNNKIEVNAKQFILESIL